MTASAAAYATLQTDPVTAARATPSARVSKSASQAQIKDTAEKFEAMFLSQMFQYMFEGVDADKEFGGGNAENMFRSMMLDEYGKQVAKRGGIGLADQVSRALLSAQEGRA